jgi:general secretion pathway protein G
MDRFPLVERDAEAPRLRGGQRSFASRKARRRGALHFGFTLIEVMLTVTIAGILLTLIATMYQSYRNRVDVNRAVSDIMVISASVAEFNKEYDRFPLTLAEIGKDSMRDPWGAAYAYVNHADASGRGSFRKDKNIVPINSDFDVWSNGKDGASAPALTANPSRDDVIRANDGGFFGLVSVYDP